MSEKTTITETKISFAFPNDLKEKLQKIAKSENRTLSAMARILIMEGIDNRVNGAMPLNGKKKVKMRVGAAKKAF